MRIPLRGWFSTLSTCGAAALLALAVALALLSCQGSSTGAQGPRPRSREAAGEQAGLPPEADLSSRAPIDQSGGAVEYRQCKLTIPVGALPETLFIEISEPTTAPKEVLAESAYQINPDSVELLKDALLAIRYYDQDVPTGRSEEDLVIVHLVNNVWVPLSNSKVYVHNNTVEAPVRYLGEYALQVISEDPRRMNNPPVAMFEFSTTEYPEMAGKPLADAQKEMEEKAPTPAETGQEGAAPGTPPAAGQKREAGEQQPPAAQTPPAPQQPKNAQTSMAPPIVERRLVAGPDDAPQKPAAREQQQKDTGAGNVAEGSAPPSAESAEQAGAAAAEAAPAEPAQTTIYFNASGSYDPDGSVVQYDWDFDADGVFDYTSHQSAYAKHTFKHNGDYGVVLKVTDNGRYPQAGYTVQVVQIRSPKAEPMELTANIGAFPPFGPCPLNVRYAASVTGGTPPYTYRWRFSDGSESALPNPGTTYPDIASHIVSFSVTDIAGTNLTGSVAVQAESVGTLSAPTQRMLLDISPTNSRGYSPYIAKFTLSAERATEPITYRVSFGDEPQGADEFVTSDPSFTHAYTTAGFYLVKVIATDAELRSASTFATVNAITPVSPREFTESQAGVGGDPYSFGHSMRIAFDYVGPQQSGGGRTVRFTPKETPEPAEELAFNWDFGDGTFSTEMKPEHTYGKDGVFEVRLTASDQLQRFRHRIWLPISAQEPAVAIQRPPYIEGPAPFSVTFDAIVTRGEQPFKYDWFIGDARRSDPTAFFTFQLPGEYTVKLDVRDKYDQPIHSPQVNVRVRPGGADYRLPLALIEPLSGSTRAVVTDYTAANPLPLSSIAVEGPVDMLDLSADGQLLALVGKDGMLLKRVANGEPVAAFLPAGGAIIAVAALQGDAAYCTVDTASGPETYLVSPPCNVQLVGAGVLLSAAGDGSVVLLKQKQDSAASAITLVAVDVAAAQFGKPQPIGSAFEARLSRDGRTAFLINQEMRLVKRDIPTGVDEFLSGGEDRKSGLAVAGDGDAVVFDSARGDARSIIYGRYDGDTFRLASVTDQTGFYSEQLGLSADGMYLLAYGSRKELVALLSGARGAKEPKVTDKDVAAEEAGGEEAVPPTQRRERFGIIRMDLSAPPAEWSITKVNPRFIWEATAQFSNAGPF